MHEAAVAAVDILKRRGDEPCLVPQVLYEFWVVCTRGQEENGLGMSIAEVEAEFARLHRLFARMLDLPTLYPEWEKLVRVHQVKGKTAHEPAWWRL